MKIRLILSFLLFSFITNAQEILRGAEKKEMKGFFAGTLNVIPTGDQAFDDSLVANLKKYWTITPINILQPGEVAAAIKDKNKYFIACVDTKGSNSYFTSPKNSTRHDDYEIKKYPPNYTQANIYIFLGDKDNNLGFGEITHCKFPFLDRNYCISALPYVIINLNTDFKYVTKIENDLHDDQRHDAMSLLYCTNPQTLKDRTLLIPENYQVDFLSEKKMSSYTFKYKYVSTAEMQSLIASNPAAYCFMPECVSTLRVSVYDPLTKSKIYDGSHSNNSMGGFSSKIIKELNDAVLNGPPAKKK